MKKINLYVNGKYICSTMQSKTCREAVPRFKMEPRYAGMTGPNKLGMVAYMVHGSDSVTARYAI